MATVLVTGGTGTLGREVVRALISAGHRARIASRHPRPAGASPADERAVAEQAAEEAGPQQAVADWAVVDWSSRAGLADAVAGVDAVVLATGALRDADITRAVIETASPATHLVYISIVGVDQVPMFYYRHKLAAEQVLIGSDRPWTILRATQFHDLALSMVRALATPPVMLVPRGARLQPVSAAEVGDRLAQLAIAAPTGRVPELGGPQVLDVTDLAGAYLRAAGKRRHVAAVPLPGAIMRAVARGALTSPSHPDGRQTFAEFLASRLGG